MLAKEISVKSADFRRRHHHSDVGCDDRNGPSVMPGLATSTARLRGADDRFPHTPNLSACGGLEWISMG